MIVAVAEIGMAIEFQLLMRCPAQDHKVLGVFNRKRPEQHVINHAEDGGVGADVEREGPDRDGAECRVFHEHAGGEASVLPDGFRKCEQIDFAQAYL